MIPENLRIHRSSNVFCIKSELAGVVQFWTYSCFESLKVRDSKRLEPVQRYNDDERIRKDSKESFQAPNKVLRLFSLFYISSSFIKFSTHCTTEESKSLR